MAAQLRWILLALSLVLLAGIWWWGRRRSSQAPGDAQLREITPALEVRPPSEIRQPEIRQPSEFRPSPEFREELETRHPPEDDAAIATTVTIEAKDREWGVPPFEPLSIHTRDFDHVPVLDGPMMVNPDAMTASTPAPAVPLMPAARLTPGRVPTLLPESSDRSTGTFAQAPNASEQQKIVTLRVCAAGEARWSGATLLSALELHGLAYGRHQVFHRRHVDGRSLFCVASLIEPGTFDVARMSSEEFRGVTLFAVLPGPVEPLLTIDELLGAARGLAQELSGMVQDDKGMPLSPQRAAALRDDVARFQAALPRG
ncbi:MAG TPA: cell division protein ZipA C-terminal FtsZ-binding domain-containing protein [Steroidobacteraceae bacterium]|jgi:cell division protein ZipA|nr:cell division protein ZipA C-terminal FtsZ-binding domain-containing protein [Steroidobacteraceae bacterium]